jgi:type IV pilus assembly protein PilE
MSNRSSFPLSATRVRGYTLTELLVTMAVLAIIVAIAVPAYTTQMQKTRRADARNALLDIAGREERFLSVSNSYSAVTTDVGYTGAWPQNVFNNYYSVTVTVPDPAFVAAGGVGPSFTITATPIGAQANDVTCGAFTLNQVGVQTVTGTGTAATCWGS